MIQRIRPVWLEVNLDNLVYNVRAIRRNLSSNVEMMGVVKADGYGHGAVEISQVLLEEGVSRLAVAVLDEAVELRKAGIDVPILVLGYTPSSQFKEMIENYITPTIYCYDDAAALSALAVESGQDIKIHLKLDTGMGRIGLLPGKDSLEVVENIYKLPGIKIEGIFTHFAVADEKDKSYTRGQYSKYSEFCRALAAAGINIPVKHVGNSATAIDLPEMHESMVRPGIILYGLYPSEEVDKQRVPLKPLASLKAKISHVKTIQPGDSVGYGRRFIAEKETVIATLPLGYADGYTRMLSRKAKVLVKGQEAPIAGNICMDQCMIDVTGIQGVEVGDEVVLMGEQGGKSITAEDLAGILGTINYEIVCMISKRVPRVYIKDGKIVKYRIGVGR
ncbi:MAG: Alanine racemase [Firmicutes bacterium]|nr:Alanine racemase [Bacillota bacterium]MDI6705248.1 alanine racemase [Bacillota bacterium]